MQMPNDDYTGDYTRHSGARYQQPSPRSKDDTSVTRQYGGDQPKNANHAANGASPHQPSLLDMATGAVQRNPVLAVAAVATVSALAVMALKSARRPKSRLQIGGYDIERQLRDIERQATPRLRAAEKRMRRAVEGSGISSAVEDFAAATAAKLSALDASQLEPLKQRAGDMFNDVVARIGAARR